MKIAIGIEYDGSRFHGWQSQPGLDTVQGVLEAAVKAIAGESVSIIAAGRTDAGVHALEQVAHFDVAASRPMQAWVRGVNTFLPAEVAVRWATAVDDDFHARLKAVSRRYRYVLFNHPIRPALLTGRVGWYHRTLDAERMHEAATHLVGTHDFSSFRSSECQAKSPVKTLHEVCVRRHGDFVMFDFFGTGFLHHMVRNIVGALLWVGYGKESAEGFANLIAKRDRTLSAPTFGPEGLYFVSAGYEDKWRLPAPRRIMSPFDPVDF